MVFLNEVTYFRPCTLELDMAVFKVPNRGVQEDWNGYDPGANTVQTERTDFVDCFME